MNRKRKQDKKQIVSVLFSFNHDKIYDYQGHPPLKRGDYVVAQLGSHERVGIVWEEKSTSEFPQLKTIKTRLDIPALPEVSHHFIQWVAGYTLSSRGKVLKMAIGGTDIVSLSLQPGARVRLGRDVGQDQVGAELYREVCDGQEKTLRELTQNTGYSLIKLKRLIREGTLVSRLALACDSPIEISGESPALSKRQREVADILCDAIRVDSSYQTFVLDGCTGSGKTEVYCEAIEACLRLRRQVLVLLPEIALSSMMFARLRRRLGFSPTLWHSTLTPSERRLAMGLIMSGEARLVLGARSTLFLPFPNLGLIIVDEEHDGSFKQESGVIYNARDMAIVRAYLGRIPICLVSATPSLETLANIQSKGFVQLRLAERYGSAQMPEVSLIDLRQRSLASDGWISHPLREAIAQTLDDNEQALLFLNRRGYAPITLCRSCGHRIECPFCSVCLVEHRRRDKLICHYCGFNQDKPSVCPSCSESEVLIPYGPGVERIDEELETLFPRARRLVLTSDTLSPPQANTLFEQIYRKEVDLLIGTQIISKGYHFPSLTLIGVVDGDLIKTAEDLRGSEKAYQLLYQIGGRAGRAERSGRVLIQTYNPGHRIMDAVTSGDRSRFLDLEMRSRRYYRMPPFGKLVAIIVSGRDLKILENVTQALARTAPRYKDVSIFGPIEAPLFKIYQRYRLRFLIKTVPKVPIQKIIAEWVGTVRVPSTVQIAIDIDPYTFV